MATPIVNSLSDRNGATHSAVEDPEISEQVQEQLDLLVRTDDPVDRDLLVRTGAPGDEKKQEADQKKPAVEAGPAQKRPDDLTVKTAPDTPEKTAPNAVEEDESEGEDVTPRQAAVDDYRDAFVDNNIPPELAETAFEASGRPTDPAKREAFVNTTLDVKTEADEVAAERAGREVTDEGFNDWKSSIAVAGKVFEKHPDGNVSAADVKAAVDAARAQWHSSYFKKDVAEVRQRYGLLETDQEAQKVIRYAERKTWLVSKVPESWQQRLGLSSERTYNEALNQGYRDIIDSKADSLLAERDRALNKLRGVDRNMPPHLLPSRQYRAAEVVTQSEEQLRRLRPLRAEDYNAARASVQQNAQQNGYGSTMQNAQQQTAPQTAQTVQHGPVQSAGSQQNVATNRLQPRAEERVQFVETAQERALSEIRRIQLATPVTYQDKATEAMSKRLQNQLLQGASSVDLSASYRGDPSQAAEAHRRAIESNMDVIEATRRAGVPVNVGQANVVTAEKKSGPEVDQQVDQGRQTEQSLQQQAMG